MIHDSWSNLRDYNFVDDIRDIWTYNSHSLIIGLALTELILLFVIPIFVYFYVNSYSEPSSAFSYLCNIIDIALSNNYHSISGAFPLAWVADSVRPVLEAGKEASINVPMLICDSARSSYIGLLITPYKWVMKHLENNKLLYKVVETMDSTTARIFHALLLLINITLIILENT